MARCNISYVAIDLVLKPWTDVALILQSLAPYQALLSKPTTEQLIKKTGFCNDKGRVSVLIQVRCCALSINVNALKLFCRKQGSKMPHHSTSFKTSYRKCLMGVVATRGGSTSHKINSKAHVLFPAKVNSS